MSRFAPIRNTAGAIVGMQPKDEGSAFASVLQDTMTAVGAIAPEEKEHAPRMGRREAAMIVGGLFLALALIVGLGLGRREAPKDSNIVLPPTVAAAPPTAAPRATPAPTALLVPAQDAYAAPDGARLGTVPLTATIGYRYGSAGWAGVEWQGSTVWVKADPALIARLPDLKPAPTPAPRVYEVPAPPMVVQSAPVEAPEPIHERPHDETRPTEVAVQQVR